MARDAGAGENFLARTGGRFGAAPPLRASRPLLPFDSRHGGCAPSPALGISRPARARDGRGGLPAVADPSAPGRRRGCCPVGWPDGRPPVDPGPRDAPGAPPRGVPPGAGVCGVLVTALVLG